MKQPHILAIPKWYPQKLYPSAGIFTQKHLAAAAQHTPVSVVFAQATPLSEGYWHEQYAREGNLNVYRFYYAKTFTHIPPIDQVLKLFLYFYGTWRGFRRIQAEVGKIHLLDATILLRTGVFAFLIKYCYKIPYVITEHWTGYLSSHGRYVGFFRKKMTNIVAKNAQAIHTASNDLARAMQQQGIAAAQWRWLPNSVDSEIFQLKKTNHNTTITKLLAVTALTDAHKNIRGILRITQKLSQTYPNAFTLHIVGQGDDEKILKSYSQELNLLDTYVFFTGKQTTAEVAQWMQESDVLFLFSNYENLPCVLVEAQCVGLPAIATNVGGVSEIISSPHLGILIDAKDETAAYQALSDVITKQITFNSTELRNNALALFEEQKIGDLLYQYYINSI